MLLYLIYKHPELEIFAGNILRADSKENYTIRQKKGGTLKKFRYTKLLMGSNFVVKSRVFEELGRFDERFGAGSYWGSGEETDFCWKAFFAHKKMEFFKELVVYHVPPFQESLKTGFTKSFKYGVGKGALVWKWLFQKRKIIVIYELIEMFTIPFLLMLRGALKLKLPIITSNIAAIAGRLTGLFKSAFS
jgi:GT2 family glycosyltransferase